MYRIDFKKPIHVHFIGIGGISMSGLAEILLKEGFTISGSDTQHSSLTTALEGKGAVIFYEQTGDNISKEIDCVVYTAAIRRDNHELIEAIARKIPLLTRAQLLGQMMTNYETPIAVSGTHGKTTTTAMISQVLLAGDLDPTISIGGILPSISGNIRVGSSTTFITEACEYTNSFLSFNPKISVILNIEEDHLDFFKDIEDIRDSFRQFAAKLPYDGILIINGDIQNYYDIYQELHCQVVTYGLAPHFDYGADNISFNEKGHVSFDLYKKGTFVNRIFLSITGEHNASNALSAIAIGELLNIPSANIVKGLLSFVGTKRRFEYKGTRGGVIVIDDYAHHPTEITATLKAASHCPHNKIWCVFQPHTYTRTKVFFQEFAHALSVADHLVIADVYAARETDTLGVSSADLAVAVRSLGTDAYHFSDFADITDFLKKNCAQGDLLITMGAGNIVDIGEDFLR